MASTRQLKHHARFHAAVLRYLFPSSSPPSNSPQQEAVNSAQQASPQVHSLESTESALEEAHSDNDEGVEDGKLLLSRAQRKRLKLRESKARQLNAIAAKKFIGPLLPGVLEKKVLVSDEEKATVALPQENTAVEQSDISISTRAEQGLLGIRKPEVLYLTAGEELAMPEKEACTFSISETGDGKEIHAEEELECLSKAKRRRLAKKRFHDSSRRPTVGSSFMAEIKGEDIIIQKIV